MPFSGTIAVRKTGPAKGLQELYASGETKVHSGRLKNAAQRKFLIINLDIPCANLYNRPALMEKREKPTTDGYVRKPHQPGLKGGRTGWGFGAKDAPLPER